MKLSQLGPVLLLVGCTTFAPADSADVDAGVDSAIDAAANPQDAQVDSPPQDAGQPRDASSDAAVGDAEVDATVDAAPPRPVCGMLPASLGNQIWSYRFEAPPAELLGVLTPASASVPACGASYAALNAQTQKEVPQRPKTTAFWARLALTGLANVPLLQWRQAQLLASPRKNGVLTLLTGSSTKPLGSIGIDTWTHVALTFEGTITCSVTGWINGQPTGAASGPCPNTALEFGSEGLSVDEWSGWPTVLTQAQIVELMNATDPRKAW
jgi:hypothetical protein